MNITDEKRSKRGGGGWDVYRRGCSFSSEVASSYSHRGIKLEEQTSGGSKISKITAFKWPFFITFCLALNMYFDFFPSSPLLPFNFPPSKKQTADPLIIPLPPKKGKEGKIGEKKFNLKIVQKSPRSKRA